MDPCTNFMDLLNSQQESQIPESFPHITGLGSSQVPHFSTQLSEELEELDDIPVGRRERRKWSQIEDIVLCSSWLNTSKDAVVGNEQKITAFWKRIGDYFNSSPKLAGFKKRDTISCKQRWQKINDYVCKFVGCYEAAKRQKTSGFNDTDVLKVAYEIFFHDYKVKFNLEHAWIELRNDQKWCSSITSKADGSSKKRKPGDQSANTDTATQQEDQPMPRPEGVKAAKAKGKKHVRHSNTVETDATTLSEFQTIWTIKQADNAMKDKFSKAGLLESLIAKKEPLSEMELALKNKILTEMLSNY